MKRAEIAKEFYIEDHAVIYGLLVKYATQMCGDSGMDSSVKGTILYAKERGLRMAMRASADGEELTPNNYICLLYTSIFTCHQREAQLLTANQIPYNLITI